MYYYVGEDKHLITLISTVFCLFFFLTYSSLKEWTVRQVGSAQKQDTTFSGSYMLQT